MNYLFKNFSIFLFWLIFCSFEYKNITTSDPLSIHILEVNPKKYEIKPTLAKDNKIGRATVLDIAKRNDAKAAINGGFFKIGTNLDGLPMGILKIDGKWISLPRKKRAAIGWKKDSNDFMIDQLDAKTCIIINDGLEIPLDGINRERKENERILYLPTFFNLYQTNPQNLKSYMILSNNCFLALDTDDDIIPFLKYNSFNYRINISSLFSLNDSYIWENLDHIVGGTPVLIYDNQKILDYSSEKTIQTFLTKKHARTAIGIKENGNLIFLVVEANPCYSIGMTMDELRDFMYDLGCTFALNLDGGGSSTMVIDNKIINCPNGDEDENINIRRVSNAILIIEKK